DILLAEVPATGKHTRNGARSLPRPGSWKLWLDRIEGRLDLLDDLLPAYGVEAFALVCATVLPERYADPAQAGKPTTNPPGSVAKREVIVRRGWKGKRAFHKKDAEALPDSIGFQTDAVENGRSGRRGPCVINGHVRVVMKEMPVVQLQGQPAEPESALQPSEGNHRFQG